MNQIIENVKRFKLKSLFVQYYIHVLILTFAMSTIFSVFVYRTYIRHMSDNHNVTLQALLTQASGETDNSLSVLYENVSSLTKDPTITKVVIAPSYEHADNNAEAVYRLYNTAQNFNYINELYLYESSKGMLFTSDEKILLKNASRYKQLIDACIANDSVCFDNTRRQKARLMYFKDRLYMICDFIPVQDDFIGMLVAEINADKLFQGINELARDTDYTIDVALPDGTMLFSTGNADDNIVFHTVNSSLSGWKFTISASDRLSYSFFNYIKFVLPFLIIIMIAGAVLSAVITTHIYTPIHKLMFLVNANADIPEDIESECPATGKMNNIAEKSAATGSSTSELDILSDSYTRLAYDNKQAEAFISDVRPELEAKLILDIIHGNSRLTIDVINQEIDMLNSELDMADSYQCCKVSLTPLKNTEQLVYYMVYRKLKQKMPEILKETACKIYFLYFNDERFSFAVQYKHGLSDNEHCNVQKLIYTELHKQFDDVSEDTLVAFGGVGAGADGLANSYREAKDELQKLIYYGNESDAFTEDEPQENIFKEKLARIQQLLDDGKIEDTDIFAVQMLRELCSSDLSTDVVKYYVSKLYDIFIEKLYSFPASSGSTEYRQRSFVGSIYVELEAADDTESIYNKSIGYVKKYTASLSQEFSKRQHKLISSAKEYIQLNYADSSLSVHDIAESIGISDTYLSSVFTEYTVENLVTYLNRFRVDMAKELLLNTGIIIKDVGYKVGFYTIQNFNRVFKRYMGMTPGEFRKTGSE